MGISFGAIDRLRLERHPNGKCYPTGVPGLGHLGWSNSNAEAIFKLLGLEMWEPPFLGVSIEEMRKLVGSARSRLADQAAGLVRSEVREFARPRQRDDGAIELRPLRYFSFGLDEDGIRRRLQDLEEFVNNAERFGATHIHWY